MKMEFRRIISIIPACIEKIFHIQNKPNQWKKRKVKDTKVNIFLNSCNHKKWLYTQCWTGVRAYFTMSHNVTKSVTIYNIRIINILLMLIEFMEYTLTKLDPKWITQTKLKIQ